MSNKFFSYFATPTGRKFTFFAAGTTTVGLFVGNFLPQTVGLNYYKDFVQCYQNGVARPVPEKVLKRLETALELLDVRPYERLVIKPFTVFGFELFQAGSTKFRFGCALGIPANFAYSQPHDMNRNEVRFRNEAINWDSEYGKLLEDAIILTENEQIFGMCKSLLQLQTYSVLLNSIFPSVSFLSVYALGNYFNQRLNLLARPLGLRLMLYSILGCFGLGSWSFMKDYHQVSVDADIDKKLSTLGPELVEAGVHYYDKMLKKNMALRALIGDDTYTSKGNENYYLRQKSLPLTIRKSYFEEKWQEMKNSAKSAAQSGSELPQ